MIRRNRLVRTALSVAVVLIASACTPRPDFEAPVGPRAELGHVGRWLTDHWGRVVTLRGVNYVKKFPPIAPAAAGFGADDAAFLRNQGFNVVRLGVVFGAVMPEPGVIDQAYVDSIASTVAVLAEEHIFTLVDFHQDGYGPATHGNGFPAWATLTDGLPNPPDPFPTYYLTNPAMQRAFENFWANKPGPDGVPLQTHYAAALTAVAAAVEDEDYVVGYDLMNEPWPGADWAGCLSGGCPAIEAERLVTFGNRMTDALRRVDREHMVFSEPFVLFNFGQADTSFSGIGAPRSGLSYHVYATTPENDEAVMDRAIAASTRGDALLATEFGATSDTATLRRLTSAFDERHLSWIFWAYDENLVHDVARAPGPGNLVTSTLDGLVRPNPMVTNGTPSSASFDPVTGAYDYTYATTRPDGARADPKYRTSILMPTRVYPQGYTVTVDGARVRTCSTTLVLKNDPDASSVRVRATRGGECGKPKVPGVTG